MILKNLSINKGLGIFNKNVCRLYDLYFLLKLFLIKNFFLIFCKLIELISFIEIRNLKIIFVNLLPKILISKFLSNNGGNSII